MAVDAPMLNRVTALLARLAGLGAAGLVVTGVPLIVLYQPVGGAAWLRTLHSLSSTLFLGAAAAMLLTAVAAVVRRHRTWVGGVLALAVAVVAAAGSYTGQLLAWDVIGLSAVVVGENTRGVIDPLTEHVRFVVVGDAEVTPAAYLWWVAVHLAVLPAAAAVVGLLVWRRWRSWAGEQQPVSEAAPVVTHDGPAVGTTDSGAG